MVFNGNPDYAPTASEDLLVEPGTLGLGGGSSEWPPKLEITAADWRSVEADKSYLYAFGFVAYRDIFGKPHKTGFGSFYSPSLSRIQDEATFRPIDHPG